MSFLFWYLAAVSASDWSPQKLAMGLLGIPSYKAPKSIFDLAASSVEFSKVILDDLKRGSHQALNPIHAVDSISNAFCSVVDAGRCVADNYPRSTYRSAAKDAILDLNAEIQSINNNVELYHSIRDSIPQDPTPGSIDEETAIVGNSLLRDFASLLHTMTLDNSKQADKLQTEINRLSQAGPLTMESVIRLAECRQKYARVHGFDSFSTMQLAHLSMKSPQEVLEFLSERLKEIRIPPIIHEIKADEISSHQSVSFWIGALCEIVQKYFGLNTIIAGPEENWWNGGHAVRLNLFDGTEDFGNIIIDFRRRTSNAVPGHYVIKTWKRMKSFNPIYDIDDIQRPTVFLSVPLDDPDKLLFDEVSALFHESGHALHSICSDTRLHHLSGTRGSFDFSEVPSMLMEKVLRDDTLIKDFLGGTTLRNYNLWMKHTRIRDLITEKNNIFYSKYDQLLHSADQLHRLTTDVDYVVDMIGCDRFRAKSIISNLKSMPHFIHYPATYFVYVLNSKIADQVHDKYIRKGRNNTLDFRKLALQCGGLSSTSEILTKLNLKLAVTEPIKQ